MIPLNDLKRSVTGESELQLRQIVEKVVLSGSYILGSEVREFEEEFAAYLGIRFVTSVASGTDALVIALRSVGVERGSKVVLTPNAGGYTATALVEIGAVPVFVDCDLSGRMDPKSLERRLTQNADASCVVATHLFGLNSNIEQVAAICKAFQVKLLEDCAQSTGAEIDGKKLGTIGDVATFSFYPTKNLGAIGDAGAIATNSESCSKVQQELRQYGWSSRYEVATPYGKNSRMDEIQAAVLRHRLPRLNEWNSRRREIWRVYEAALQDSEWSMVGKDSNEFVAHLGVVVAPQGMREKSMDLLKTKGVSTSIHYPVLDYLQIGWTELMKGNCPNAEGLATRIFTIPQFPELTDEEVEVVATALREMSLELSSGF